MVEVRRYPTAPSDDDVVWLTALLAAAQTETREVENACVLQDSLMCKEFSVGMREILIGYLEKYKRG